MTKAYNDLPKEEKAKYIEKAEADKLRYQNECNQLLTQGYFIN